MIYEDRTEEIVAEARMLMNDSQIDGDIDILEGDPADAIIEHADRISADLIVMGSRDQNRLKNFYSEASVKNCHRNPIFPC